MSDIQVLDRAVTLIRALAAEPEPLSLARVAKVTGLSRSTARRVLASLDEHGICERLEGGRYRLGLGLFEWGMVVRERLDLRERSRLELEALARRTALTAFLCVRDGDRAVCIDRVDGYFAHTLALRLGGSIPLHAGAASRILLAYASDPELDTYLATSVRVRLTERTCIDEQAIRGDVGEIRAQGWSLSDGDVSHGTAAIGAPVFDHAGSIAAAISVSGLRPHVIGERLDELVSHVFESSVAISRNLGFVDGRTLHTVAVP